MGVARSRSLRLYGWLIAILLVLVVVSPDTGDSRAIRAAHDFAHAPVFGVVCIAMLLMMREWSRLNDLRVEWQYAIAIVVTSVFGLVTEVAQAFFERDASWLDARSDILGTLAAACVFAAFDQRVSRSLAKVTFAFGIAAFVWHSIPLLTTAADYVRRTRDFPVLLAGDRVERNGFLSGSHAHLEQRAMPQRFARAAHERALYVRFEPGTWPGIHLDEPVPDWSGFGALMIDVANPGDTVFTLKLRVHDRKHDQRFEDRFNREYELPPNERTTLRVPLAEIERGPSGRLLDLRQVAGVILFTTNDAAGRELYLSRIWLEHDH